jgi:hypothetical protein
MTTETANLATPKTAKAPSAPKEVAIQLHQPGMPAQRVASFRGGGVDRPIMASHMQIVRTFYIAGERPVMASGLDIKEIYPSMGSDRPVASNEIDDAPTLMGFLD